MLAERLSVRAPPVVLCAIPEPAQVALLDMAYQLGAEGVCGFTRLLRAVAAADWQRAHDEALASRWDEETPHRCERVAERFLGLLNPRSPAAATHDVRSNCPLR